MTKKLENAGLLLVDVVNTFDFPNADDLFANFEPAVERIVRLKERAKEAKVPVIYANDNFGKWSRDFRSLVKSVHSGSDLGRRVLERIGPDDDDYYILKPHRSAFYKTPLGVLLADLKVRELVIAGVTTDICVLFTANDATMRDLTAFVPGDASACVKKEYHREALEIIERSVDADTRPSAEIEFTETRS